MQDYRKYLRTQPLDSLSVEQRQLLKFPFFELFTKQYRAKTFSVVALAGTVCMGHYAVMSWVPAWINQLTGTLAVQERSIATLFQDSGAILAAASGGFMIMSVGRAWSFRIAFIGSLVSCITMFVTTKSVGPCLHAWLFVVGFFVIAPYTYLFIYVPELFETRLRATAFAFSIQFGRVFAGLAAILGGQLISAFGGSYAMGGACVSLFFIAGVIATFFLPKSSGLVSKANFSIPPAQTEQDAQAVASV